MRLLDTHTGHFVEKVPKSTKYAILSHTWDQEKGEQTYKQLRKIQKRYEPHLGSSATRPLPAPSHALGDSPVTALPSTPSGLHAPPESQTDVPVVTSASSSPPRDASSSSFSPVLCLEGESEEDAPRPIWDDPELSPKIRKACEVARANGFQYIWIDSCCIDKSSSSELSEAINSMYVWYARAVVCYAYLADVPAEEDHHAEGSQFRKSRWFTRGWTLQELIAPSRVEFLSRGWTVIGSKHALVSLVESVTGIDDKALLHLWSLPKFSVSQRLSWASKRETTRVEDEAYSLLGLFDINMPTLYGEGERAFRRLQEEIMRRIPDQSLFAWGNSFNPAVSQMQPKSIITGRRHTLPWGFVSVPRSDSSFLAPRLSDFAMDGGSIKVAPSATFSGIRRRVPTSYYQQIEYTTTPYGVRTQFPMIPLSRLGIKCSWSISGTSKCYVAVLGCEHRDYPGCLLGKICHALPSSSVPSVEFLYPSSVMHKPRFIVGHDEVQRSDLLLLSPQNIKRYRKHIKLKTVYIPHPDHHDSMAFLDSRSIPYSAIRLIVLKETSYTLARRGYTTTLRGPDQDYPTTHWLELSDHEHTITITFRHTLGDDGRELTIMAHVGHSSGAEHTGALYWTDTGRESDYSEGWSESLASATVELDVGEADPVIVTFCLHFLGMGFYAIDADVPGRPPRLPSIFRKKGLRLLALLWDRAREGGGER